MNTRLLVLALATALPACGREEAPRCQQRAPAYAIEQAARAYVAAGRQGRVEWPARAAAVEQAEFVSFLVGCPDLGLKDDLRVHGVIALLEGYAAAAGLGEDAIQVLGQACADPRPEVTRHVTAVLLRTRELATPVLRCALTQPTSEARLVALSVAGRLGSAAAPVATEILMLLDTDLFEKHSCRIMRVLNGLIDEPAFVPTTCDGLLRLKKRSMGNALRLLRWAWTEHGAADVPARVRAKLLEAEPETQRRILRGLDHHGRWQPEWLAVLEGLTSRPTDPEVVRQVTEILER